MWLTSKQIESLTRRKRPSAQIRILAESGIPFMVVDGRPIVVDTDLSHRQTEKRVRKL